MSEPDLENICERLAREHNLYVEPGEPKVIYLETVRDALAAEGEFVSQAGGRGYYAHVVIRIEPNSARGYELVNDMPEGAIPSGYIGAIDRGIRYALKAGVDGHEMIDVRAILCDGSYHETDSDEGAFETAGFMAVKDALRKASPVLLEPVVSLQLVVPKDVGTTVTWDLKSHGADITSRMENGKGKEVIRAIAPLAEVMGYGANLETIGGESATYTLELLRYQPVQDLPSVGDDAIGVPANKPWKPKPKRGAVAVEPPLPDADC